jgi:TetR/AcrR family transcriptional regulator, regulator of autoinduction and epiphytic fitness
MTDVPPTRLTDRKRAAILKAATIEFCARGFDNTSMNAIAEAAEVSKRTVYNHFPSKESLFSAIVDKSISRCGEMVEYPLDPGETLENQLTRIGQSAIRLFTLDDFQDLARVVFSRFLQSPELAHSFVAESGNPEIGVVKWVEAAHAAQRLDVQDPIMAGKQFVALISSFAFWPQVIGNHPPLSESEQEAVIRSAVEMFLSCYAKEP